MELEAMSAMKSEASRRWRLLTFTGMLEGCCDVRLEALAELRACFDFGLSRPDIECVAGGTIAAVGAGLLLDVWVCGFAKITRRF